MGTEELTLVRVPSPFLAHLNVMDLATLCPFFHPMGTIASSYTTIGTFNILSMSGFFWLPNGSL